MKASLPSRVNRRRIDCVDVFWFAGMSCDGCSIAATGSESPALMRLQRGVVPGMPEIRLHHPLFSMESGSDFLEDYGRATRDELGRPYIMVLEGSATREELAGEGYWAALGSGGIHPGADYLIEGIRQPIATMDWVKALAPRAEAAVALGTCASWGGVPAAYGNVTGAMSLADLLGPDYRSSLGLPVVNLPGCAPGGDNIMETLAALLLYLQGVGPVPEFDELGRPSWLFTETAHRSCSRAGYYEEGAFAASPGEKECLVEMGCWGAVVECNMSVRGAINGLGGCMNTGGACIGCTMPGFPDQFTPFYETAVGSSLSTLAPADKERSGIRRLPIVTASPEPAPAPGSGVIDEPGAPDPAGPLLWPVGAGGEAIPAPGRAWSFAAAPKPGDDRGPATFYERWRLLAGVTHE